MLFIFVCFCTLHFSKPLLIVLFVSSHSKPSFLSIYPSSFSLSLIVLLISTHLVDVTTHRSLDDLLHILEHAPALTALDIGGVAPPVARLADLLKVQTDKQTDRQTTTFISTDTHTCTNQHVELKVHTGRQKSHTYTYTHTDIEPASALFCLSILVVPIFCSFSFCLSTASMFSYLFVLVQCCRSSLPLFHVIVSSAAIR